MFSRDAHQSLLILERVSCCCPPRPPNHLPWADPICSYHAASCARSHHRDVYWYFQLRHFGERLWQLQCESQDWPRSICCVSQYFSSHLLLKGNEETFQLDNKSNGSFRDLLTFETLWRSNETNKGESTSMSTWSCHLSRNSIDATSFLIVQLLVTRWIEFHVYHLSFSIYLWP